MANVKPGTILNEVSTGGVYEDVFQVWDDDRGGCKTATDAVGYALRTYVATSPEPGLLSIEERQNDRECSEKKPDQSPPSTAIGIEANGDVSVTARLGAPAGPELPNAPDCDGNGPVPGLVTGFKTRAAPAAAEDAEPLVVGGADALAEGVGAAMLAEVGGPLARHRGGDSRRDRRGRRAELRWPGVRRSASHDGGRAVLFGAVGR
jgi:hypothetical protein